MQNHATVVPVRTMEPVRTNLDTMFATVLLDGMDRNAV